MGRKPKTIRIGPQPGTQERFLASRADVLFFGGAAGGGKSYSLLLYPLQYVKVPGFTAIIFRRTFSEITNPGGLWDEAMGLYPKLGAVCKGKPDYTAQWPGAKVVFRHLEHESDMYSHQGGQYAMIGFDEVTLFTEAQFVYLMSRNRTTCGVRPFMCATCNPDASSWAKKWIQWWLDDETGYPIEEHSGRLKYFTRSADGGLLWVDENWRHPEHPEIGPKSITFIPSKIEDNRILMERNPDYKASLLAQCQIDRERLLFGNWNARAEDGMFNPDWFESKDQLPTPTTRKIRVWDRAATEKDERNKNPDFTAGVCGYFSGDILCIEDVQRFRASPAKNEEKILETAKVDGRDTEIVIEREPASSGKDVIHYYKERVLKDFVVRDFRPTGERTDAAKPLSALAERHKVWLKIAPWNRDFKNELGAFPPESQSGHDDIVCATVRLLTELSQEFRILSGYSSKNLYPPTQAGVKDTPKGMDYAVLYQEKDLRVYGCFLRWDYQEKILYVYDELVMQGFTIPQLKQILVTKTSPGRMFYCNDFMNKDGDSVARLLARDGVSMVESPRFNDNGALPVVNMMFQTFQLYVHTRCVETDRQLRTWMLEDGKPQTDRIGCAKCICMTVSDLRDKKKIEPPQPMKPYSAESRMFREQVVAGRPPNPIPVTGYSRKLRHWQV